MKLVGILHKIEDPVRALADQFPDVRFVWTHAADELAREIADAEAMLASGAVYTAEIARAVREHGRRLKWMQSRSIGIDKFMLHGVPPGVSFCNARGINGRTESEHAVAMLLALSRRLIEFERYRLRREWDAKGIRERIVSLEGHTVAVVGFGSIGRQVARKVRAFDAHVVAVTRRSAPEEGADETIATERLDEALPRVDAVVLAVPLTRETRHLIGEQQLRRMKPSAILINVARGAVVDQAALARALGERRIAGAGLDVFDSEPLPADDPLWTLDNVIISHHQAGAGGEAALRFAELVAENLRRLRDGRPLLNVIDLQAMAV